MLEATLAAILQAFARVDNILCVEFVNHFRLKRNPKALGSAIGDRVPDDVEKPPQRRHVQVLQVLGRADLVNGCHPRRIQPHEASEGERSSNRRLKQGVDALKDEELGDWSLEGNATGSFALAKVQ